MSKTTPKRGDIFLFDFGPNSGNVQGGRRPGIVLQNNRQNASSPTTIIAPITSKANKKRSMSAHVAIGINYNLRFDSQILLEQLTTVNKDALGTYIGHVDDDMLLRSIDYGLCKTLGIRNYPTKTDAS